MSNNHSNRVQATSNCDMNLSTFSSAQSSSNRFTIVYSYGLQRSLAKYKAAPMEAKIPEHTEKTTQWEVMKLIRSQNMPTVCCHVFRMYLCSSWPKQGPGSNPCRPVSLSRWISSSRPMDGRNWEPHGSLQNIHGFHRRNRVFGINGFRL